MEESTLLQLLAQEQRKVTDSFAFAATHKADHQALIGLLNSLAGDGLLELSPRQTNLLELTEEGQKVLVEGSPEARVFAAIPAEGGSTQEELVAGLGKDCVKIGMGPLMKAKAIRREGEKFTRVLPQYPDEAQAVLRRVEAEGGREGRLEGVNEDVIKTLRKRQLVAQVGRESGLEGGRVTRKSFSIIKGPHFALQRTKKAADLTKEMLDSGDWKTTTFKDYNFQTLGAPVQGGYFHPLLKVRAQFRQILMSMGFQEMPTNKWVESSFWNFDALFQPQSHPARDAHDTFFVKEPKECLTVPPEYYERVKTIHEDGGYGSIGYGCAFQKEEAFKNLLRTHTTAVSARMLYKLANQPGGFTPQKYFSIDRVFRNESMDATHLCEFHQVEGLVADRNLTLGDLIGTIRTFFELIGITDLKFKPAYNPYTEPSMEIFGYHPDLKKWTEIGNSGMFRPEMLRPMGLPEDVRVIAWGLSLERPTMIKY
ncbi:hypothetical protein VYU27_008669, partial [Nannochloropsis oceanica]